MRNGIPSSQITTVCCVCGGHNNGPWPAATNNLSHGYCKQHYQMAMQEIQAYLALMERQQSLAPRALAA
jgi:hypothetical protein